MLSPMRYKSFVWPHNPHTYEVSHTRALKARKMPFAGFFIQDMGSVPRVFTGEGEFVGENAYGKFAELANCFNKGGAGLLVHPLWPAVNAYFARLGLKQEPREDYVSYFFEFWEQGDGSADAQEYTAPALNPAEPSYIYAAEGESVYSLITRSGLTLDELLRLNPQIRNINIIAASGRIRIA